MAVSNSAQMALVAVDKMVTGGGIWGREREIREREVMEKDRVQHPYSGHTNGFSIGN